MAIAFSLNKVSYRLMFKYGWFYTNQDYPRTVARRMLRDLMANSIVNSKESMHGDLEFNDDKGNSGKKSTFTWRMCSVFVNRIVKDADGKVVESTIVVGPYTGVCVPGDRFQYNEARYHALITMHTAALKERAHAIEHNRPIPETFRIAMEGYVAYGKRPRG